MEDVRTTVQALLRKGVTFRRFSHLKQDELGIWTTLGGTPTVAWLQDPDGNLLSISNIQS